MGQLHVRVSDVEHAVLRDRAFDARLSLAAYVRSLVFPVVETAVGGRVPAAPIEEERPPVTRMPVRVARPVSEVLPSAARAAVARSGHRHSAESNGPVSKCSCGAVRVAGEWREVPA